MADTPRTRTALLALMADNVTKNISAQDLRDFMVTVMNTEFANEGDFWAQPKPDHITTDKTIRGWIDYSQTIESTVSFGGIVARTVSNTWIPADATDSTLNFELGVAGDSYETGVSTAQILRRGLIYDSGLSARFSGFIGLPIYLISDVAASLSVTIPTNSVKIIGCVQPDGIGSVTACKWRFDPDWSIIGT